MEERKGDLRFNNENCLERGTVPVDLESKLWGERRKSINAKCHRIRVRKPQDFELEEKGLEGGKYL